MWGRQGSGAPVLGMLCYLCLGVVVMAFHSSPTGFGSAVVEARFPKLIPSLQNIKRYSFLIICHYQNRSILFVFLFSVACGEVTSGAITQEGKLYLWGDPLLAKAYYWSQPTLFLVFFLSLSSPLCSFLNLFFQPLKDNKISKVALGDQYAIAIAIRGPLPEGD